MTIKIWVDEAEEINRLFDLAGARRSAKLELKPGMGDMPGPINLICAGIRKGRSALTIKEVNEK